ncbi:MAG: glycosyltransferase, partial [Actinomycetota bacterium]|nr:glycosyltransferase [Actinomycetota bacterium]
RYLGDRAAALPRALASPIGITAGAATAAGFVALFTDGNASIWTAALSLILWLIAVLMLADRIRIVSEKAGRPAPAPVSAAAVKPVPSPERGPTALEQQRLESALQSLAHLEPGAGRDQDAPTADPDRAAPVEPLITVVVPCFNDGRYLVDCLESIKSQTYENWECIVVDDASTDDSVRIAWKVTRTDDRIRVVRHTRNTGLSAARNTGLRLAEGELVTFVDSDDFLTEDSLVDRVRHLAPFMGAADVAGVFCGTVLAPEDSSPGDYRRGRNWSKASVDFVTSGDVCPFNVHAVLARTSVLEAAGGFDESMLHGAEDWDLWYRVMRNGFRFEPSGLASAIYRQKPSSMRQRHAAEHFGESQRLTEASQHDAEASIVFQGAVSPMCRSKGHYEASARLARRAIQSAATSLLAGDEAGAVDVLSSAEPVHPAVLARHAQPEIAVSDGFRRYLGLTTAELAPLRSRLEPISDHAADLVAEHMAIASIETKRGRLDLDVLLVPQTAYQLSQMLDAVAGTTLRVGVVDSSAAAGDQGVADGLEGGLPEFATILSYNEAALGRIRARVVVVSYPRDAAIDDLALRYVADGVPAVVLRSDLETTLRIDAAPPTRLPSRGVTPVDLAAACRSGDVESLASGSDPLREPASGWPAPTYGDAARAWTIEE